MHTYLGIFRVDPLGIVTVAPERTLAVCCWMTFSAVRAVCRVRAGLVCSSGWDGRFGFEVSLAKSARMMMGFRLVRAGAVAAAQLGCFAPSDCVAPAPALLTEGSTSIGSCSAYIAAASAEKKGLVDDAPGMGPSLGVPDVDVHLGGCTRVGIAYDAAKFRPPIGDFGGFQLGAQPCLLISCLTMSPGGFTASLFGTTVA